MTISLISVVMAGFFSLRAARTSHQLTVEREWRLEEQSVLKAAQRVYEPLAQSAAELQSRIFNIVQTGWVALVKRYESHCDYTTAAQRSCSLTTSAGSRLDARPRFPPASKRT